MPSQNILDGLENLQEKLQQLEPAIEHISIAREIVAQVSAIPEKHEQFIADSQAQIAEYGEQSARAIQGGVDKLKAISTDFASELRQVAESCSTSIQGNTRKSAKTAADLAATATSLNEQIAQVTATLTTVIANTEKKLSGIASETEASIGRTDEKLKITSEGLESAVKRLTSTATGMETFLKGLTELNIPLRFEKLDNTIAAINLGMQNQQNFLSRMEQSLVKAQSEAQSYIIEGQKELIKKSKNQQIQLIVIMILIVAVAVIMFLK